MNIQFHLTNICNLRCKHCYQECYSGRFISFDDFCLIIKKTQQFFSSIGDPLHSLALTGGEPLTVPGFSKYLLYAGSVFSKVLLMTNGILLSPELLSSFQNCKSLRAIQVSLEGPEEINDSIRGKGTYKQIRQSIKFIKDVGLRCNVSCTVAPYNFDKVTELYDDLIAYDSPDSLWFDRCIPFKRNGLLTTKQFQFFVSSLRQLRLRWENEILPTEPVAGRALQWIAGTGNNKKYVCGAGIRHFTVMPTGDVMLCRRLNFPVGNLLEEDWPDIIKCAIPLLEKIHALPDVCKGCMHAGSCYGGLRCFSYALYKDFNKKDVNCPF